MPYSEAIITEIYFDEDGNWTIEIYYDFYQDQMDDYYLLITSTDTATYVKFPGEDNIVLLTQSDLDHPIEINPLGECIKIETIDFHGIPWVLTKPFAFGNHAQSHVPAPLAGQSLVGITNAARNNQDHPVYEVLDTAESLGFLREPARGILKCNVYDSTGNLMPYIRIKTEGLCDRTTWSDQNGAFADTLFAKHYRLHIENNNSFIYDTLITVQPDSTTTHDIHLPVSASIDLKGYCQLAGQNDYSGTRIIITPECPFAPNDTAYTNKKGYFRKSIQAGHYYFRYSHHGYRPYYTNIVKDYFQDVDKPSEYLYQGNVVEVGRGEVSGRWPAYFPYWVFGDIKVPAGDTLILDPGVEFVSKGKYRIDVHGTLIAEGTENDSIYFFNTNSDTLHWHSFNFYDSATASSLKYVHAEEIDSGIRVYNSLFNLKHSRLTEFNHLLINGKTSPYFGNNVFTIDEFPKFYIQDKSSPLFHKNIFFNVCPWQWILFYCSDSTLPEYYYNDFHNFYFSIGFAEKARPTIVGNIFNGKCAIFTIRDYHVVKPIAYNDFDCAPSYRPLDYPGFGEKIHVNHNGDLCDNYQNIFEDPLFTDTQNGDFSLQPDSPCIDAADPGDPLDPDSTIADMGALYFDQLYTGITYKNENHRISIAHFPNPVGDYVNFIIDLPIAGDRNATINIFDQDGKQICSLPLSLHQDHNSRIVRTYLLQQVGISKAGTYIYALELNGQMASGKMTAIK